MAGSDLPYQVARDQGRQQELKALAAPGTYEQGDFVKEQGWASMPGETEAHGKVADECARLLLNGK